MNDPAFPSPSLAEAHFYQAFSQLDFELMSRIWLDSPEVFCVHPGSNVLLGVRAVLNSWRSMFSQAAPVSISYKVIKREMRDDMALHLVEERIGTVESGRQGVVLASNCYIRTASGWRLYSHHGSVVPTSPPTEQPVMH